MIACCRTCDHFLLNGRHLSERDPRDRAESEKLGVCRRYPPRIVATADGGHDSCWPGVHRAQRCGEYLNDYEGGSPC